MERRGGGGGHDDDDEPMELIHHEGYEYEKPWMDEKTLWTCTVLGCGGQLSVTPVRSKRWRHRCVDVFCDARGGRTVRKVYRRHNHPSATVAVVPKRKVPDSGGLKVFTRNGKRLRSETEVMKSSFTQTMNIENNNDHIVEKRVENKNSNGTNFDKSINSKDTNAIQCGSEKKNKTSLSKQSGLFYNSIIEIPSVLNKKGSHTINNSNSEKVNQRIAICDTDVLKCTDKNKDTIVYDLKSYNETKLTDLQKTKPLQLLRCKQCYIYVVQKNYQQHINTVAHKIAVAYYKSKNVQVIKGHCENVILNTRIVSTCNSDSIHDFFNSIEDPVKNLIGVVLHIINGPIKVFIKMFALYQKMFSQNTDSILGDVMTFIIKDEILTCNTVFWPWFEKVSNTFKLHNQNYLNAVCQKSHRLVRVMFLEIYFFKAPNQHTVTK